MNYSRMQHYRSTLNFKPILTPSTQPTLCPALIDSCTTPLGSIQETTSYQAFDQPTSTAALIGQPSADIHHHSPYTGTSESCPLNPNLVPPTIVPSASPAAALPVPVSPSSLNTPTVPPSLILHSSSVVYSIPKNSFTTSPTITAYVTVIEQHPHQQRQTGSPLELNPRLSPTDDLPN